MTHSWSSAPTRWAVICQTHEQVYLTLDEYDRQMNRANARWICPLCGDVCKFDDDNYEYGPWQAIR